MISELYHFLSQQIQHNQFSQAALLAAPVTAATYMARSLPGKLYHGTKRLISVDVRFNSDMSDYEAITRFITQNVVKDTFSRNFTYQVETRWDSEAGDDRIDHQGLTLGYGTHFGMFERHPVIVERFLEDASATSQFKEHMTLTFFTRRKTTVQRFAQAVAKAAGENIEQFSVVPVHINRTAHWSKMGKLPLRRMDSVFTAGDAGERVVKLIRDFEAKREENHRLGLPHHLGIMLHGEPGCGKSSLIHAVATELQRSIFYLNLGSVTEDSDLTSLLSGNRDWSKIILAVEDIDAAGVKVNRDKDEGGSDDSDDKSPVTLSALLNVFDGILCPDDLVVIATTNHYDKLDPALKREGRFDHTVELGKLGYADFQRMANLFNKDPQAFAVGNDVAMSGAAMRALILEAA